MSSSSSISSPASTLLGPTEFRFLLFRLEDVELVYKADWASLLNFRSILCSHAPKRIDKAPSGTVTHVEMGDDDEDDDVDDDEDGFDDKE